MSSEKYSVPEGSVIVCVFWGPNCNAKAMSDFRHLLTHCYSIVLTCLCVLSLCAEHDAVLVRVRELLRRLLEDANPCTTCTCKASKHTSAAIQCCTMRTNDDLVTEVRASRHAQKPFQSRAHGALHTFAGFAAVHNAVSAQGAREDPAAQCQFHANQTHIFAFQSTRN